MISPSKRLIISVNGINEAKNFSLNRGENIILRDNNEDIIYIKSCDDLGKYTLKIYSCLDVTEQYLNENTTISATKSDVEKLSNELSEVKKLFMEVMNEYNVKQSKSE